MRERHLVLDTNAFRGLPRKDVERLASSGWRFVVSEVAISETLAASVRELERGLPRDRARGLLFKRAKLFARHVDPNYPIAVAGEHVFERVRRAISGVATDDGRSDQHVSYLDQFWRVLVGTEFLDEEWIAAGHHAEAWLTDVDAALHRLARREEDLWAKVKAPVEEKRALWLGLTYDEQLATLCERFRADWGLEDDAVADRLDAHVRFLAWRLHRAAKGIEMPKENDAPDFRFSVHLGEGFVLLSGDESFVRLVDESGTHQAPWVRRLRDLDDPLPSGPPWGPSAHEAARTFRRSE